MISLNLLCLYILSYVLHALGSPTLGSNNPNHTMTPPEVNKCRSDLLRHYGEVLSKIHTDPLNPNSRIRLEDIYTNLYLLKEVEKEKDNEGSHAPKRHAIFTRFEGEKGKRARKKKQHLPDDEFRKLIQPGQPPYRILLDGEAGVGKTTFLAKLANDWMTGTHFKDIELLFRIPLREAEKSDQFGNIVQKYLSDATIYGKRLDEYVRTHQSKVMLLLDGLDEFKGDISGVGENNVLAKIIGGDKFKECVVVITTRPWRADKILNNSKLEDKFTFVTVEGFAEENIKEYAGKFFHADQSMAKSLQQFLEDDTEKGGVFSTLMAPFPIFLAMLCHVWKNDSTRKEVMKLETVSQLMNLMAYVLKEHYALKADGGEYGEIYKEHMQNATNSFSDVGNEAYPHDPSIVTRPLVFDQETSPVKKDSFETVCKIGLLTMDKTVAPVHVRQKEGIHYITEYRIPHLLILDYLAATYLASLHTSDLTEKITELIEGTIDDIDRFEYLWYFTVAQNKDVGRATLDVLKQEVDNVDFVIRVAFECHDKGVITPVTSAILDKRYLLLQESRSFPAYVYSLGTSSTLVSIRGGAERMQHLRSLISKKSGTKSSR